MVTLDQENVPEPVEMPVRTKSVILFLGGVLPAAMVGEVRTAKRNVKVNTV